MKKIIIILVSLILIVFSSVFLLVSKNNKYTKSIEKEIKENYDVKDKIKYLNKYGLYYIIVTTDNLIVLDGNYQEILKERVNGIKLDTDKEIVYRLGNVMYEVKKVSKNKIVYSYYDIYTNELIDEVEVGG